MPTDPAVVELLEFLRFPSVSTDPARTEDTRACADWVAKKLRDIGLETTVHPTPGHPVVLGKTTPHRAGRPTVLIYGHYDVQPADPLELWQSPPFEPRVENGVVFARGATDNKGQILAHIRGVQAAQEGTSVAGLNGALPVNVIFLVEGEEEIGSPNLEPFLRAHRDELQCDVVAISDTGMVGTGRPTFTYGLRGVAAVEVRVTGPTMDLHSGIFGGAVANPATALTRLLATLHTSEGKVAIEGFYDDVRPVEDWERAAWKNLPMSDDALLALTGAPATFGEAGYTTVERFSARPTAEINGLGSGYQGEGSKTIIPAKAMAKLTFRLVPDQDPAKILAAVEAHLRKHCPPGVKLELVSGHAGAPYACDPHSAHGEAAQRALRQTFPGAEPALIREGGSIPIVTTFREVLGVETLLLGLALPDCRAHSPNENFPLANFFAGIRLNQALLRELGTTKKA
jgi:acetylornithine deacetylase/succinyl-diaminopimelate desuccinylase-like protein